MLLEFRGQGLLQVLLFVLEIKSRLARKLVNTQRCLFKHNIFLCLSILVGMQACIILTVRPMYRKMPA